MYYILEINLYLVVSMNILCFVTLKSDGLYIYMHLYIYIYIYIYIYDDDAISSNLLGKSAR